MKRKSSFNKILKNKKYIIKQEQLKNQKMKLNLKIRRLKNYLKKNKLQRKEVKKNAIL